MTTISPIITQPFYTNKTDGLPRAPDADAWLEAAAKVMGVVPFARLWHEAHAIAGERGARLVERAHCEAALTRLVEQQPYPFEAAWPTSGTGLPLVCEAAS